MRQILAKLLCCFIPGKENRRKVRDALSRNKYDIILEKITKLHERIDVISKNVDFANGQILSITKDPLFFGNLNIKGNGNVILIWNEDVKDYVPLLQSKPGLFIDIDGDNNTIKIGCPQIIERLNIFIHGNGHEFSIGKYTKKFKGHVISPTICLLNTKAPCKIIIGDNANINKDVLFVCNESNTQIIVGNNCRFAEGVAIWSSDSHAIVDTKTNKILNKSPGQIRIGDWCWCGYRSYLGKNTVLPNYTVVGAKSVVTKPFTQEYTVIAGNPAKVIKTGVRHYDERADCTFQELEELSNS